MEQSFARHSRQHGRNNRHLFLCNQACNYAPRRHSRIECSNTIAASRSSSSCCCRGGYAVRDLAGIHLAQEVGPESTAGQMWAETIRTFLTKLMVAWSFAIPLLLLPLHFAVMALVAGGLPVIIVLCSSHFVGIQVHNSFA